MALAHIKHGRLAENPNDISLSPYLVADIVATIELTAIVVAGVGAKLIYINGYLQQAQPTLPYVTQAFFLIFVLFLINRHAGLYAIGILRGAQIPWTKLLTGLVISFLILLAFLYLLKESESQSRVWMVSWFAASAALLAVTRIVARRRVSELVAHGRMRQRVAVYGVSPLAEQVANYISTTCVDFELAGTYTHERNIGTPSASDDLDRMISDGRRGIFDKLVIALPDSDSEHLCDVVERVSILALDIELCLHFALVPIPLLGSRLIGQMCTHVVLTKPFSHRVWLVKTVLDYVLAVFAAIVLLPLLLAIAIGIKLDTEGPVFFRQRRHGRNGTVFTIYKFRTMTVLEDGATIRQAERNDPRVTRVGRLLRRASLDELPQLFNVLRGEMSIIGPRPHALSHDELYSKLIRGYRQRHRVKPGITGWAQVHGLRGETKTADEMRSRMEYDIYYVQNWSIWLDLEILVRSCVAAVKGAY